ncbi:MAG: FapA family protein [Syntrophorhabdales bacterium]
MIDALQAHGTPYWIDKAAIDAMIKKAAAGQRTLVASAKDGTVVVTVEKGEREAYIVLEPAYGGRDIERKDVEKALTAQSVRAGVDWETVEQVISLGKYGSRILIAKAQEPVHGEDSKIEYLFRTQSVIHPKEVEGLKVDYKELETVVSVRKGEILAKKTPATKGQDGFTVTGKTLPARPGKDERLAAGKSTKLSDDRLQLIADVDGQPVLRDKSVTVEPVLTIDGDIDYTTGNINFAGSVRVLGNVVEGFTLKATENINIDGLAEDCCIEAGGDVLIKGGIQGGKNGMVKAGGNVSALFIERASIEAGGSISAGQTLHCTLFAGDQVVVTVEKGHICGGTVSARNLIQARIIGSEYGTWTELAVGFQPKDKARLEELKQERIERKAALVEAEKGTATLDEFRAEGMRWWPRHEQAYERLQTGRTALMQRLDDLNREIAALEQALGSSEAPQIKVVKIIYPNVKIHIHETAYLNQAEVQNTLFCEKDNQIEAMPYVA